MTKIIQIAISTIIAISLAFGALAQTAGLLPMGQQQFFDNNGNPLSGGFVYTYIVGTTTLKTTWQNSSETIVNTNPIVLNAAGRAIIYGDGAYRQIVRDRNGNLIWDAVTSATGSGGGATLFGDGTSVGTILPWSGITAPTHYVFAYGQELSRVTYSSLYTTLTLTSTVTCASASAVLTGLSDTTQIPIGAPVEISCVAAGTTVLSKTASTVTVSNNASVNISATAIFFPWGNGNGTSTFNVPDLRGRVLAGRNNLGGTASTRLTTTYYGASPDGLGSAGGIESKALATANLPAYTPAGTIVSTETSHTHFLFNTDLTGVGGTLTNTNQSSFERNSGTSSFNDYIIVGSATAATIGLSSSATPTITSTFTGTAQGGVATAFSIVQPSITMNYIIKITPDQSISTLNVVTSIGGMSGDITCGSGLVCSGNNISVSGGGGPGSVTSVDLSMPGIFTVSGNPITTAGTLTVMATGTSGGIPYFSSSSALASSAVLGANLPLIGGGAGIAPTVGTRSGNTTAFVTTTGTQTSGNCVSIDANGNHIASGSACGGGGGGSPGGSNTQVQYNNLGSFGGIAGATTDGTILTMASNDFALAGSSSGNTKLNASAVATGTITVPAATDTLVGKATTDTLTNKTYDTAGTGNNLLINGLAVTANQGTGAVVRANTPTLTTPVLGVATATSINGLIITATAGTLTIPNNASASLITSGNFALTLTATATTNSTLPSGSHTLAALDVAQTWTAAQSFGSGDLKINGATSGSITVNAAAIAGTNTLTLPAGTTDFSATGGTSQVVKQTSSGGAFTVARLACGDLSDAVATCSSSSSSTLVVGSTVITSGTTTRVLYDNAGVLGEMTTTGTGTQLMLAASPTTTGTLTAAIANFSGAVAITSNSANAFAVGRLGTTTPALNIDASVASSVTGINIIGRGSNAGVDVAATSSVTDENLRINAKGAGTVTIGGTSTGQVNIAGSANQVRIGGASGTVALTFFSDNLTGIGTRTPGELNFYIVNGITPTEVMRWTLPQISTVVPFSAGSTLFVDTIRTIASGASIAWNDFQVSSETTTLSGSTNVTGVIGKASFFAPTITSASAIAVTTASTVYIDAPPIAAGSTTITNPYSLWVNSGNSQFGGKFGSVYLGQTVASAASPLWNALYVLNTLTLTGTTAVTSDIGMAHFFQPSITDASAVTISQASTVLIDGAPTQAGSATISNAWALKIAGGNVSHPAGGACGTPTQGYINWGNTGGDPGYGIRDCNGTIQTKNSGGAWAAISGSVPCTTTALSVQYNAAGVFGCISGVTSDAALMQFAAGSLALRDNSAAFNVLINATDPATISATRTLTLGMGNVAHTLNFGTTANTITFPNAASYTVAGLSVAQTFTGAQTFGSGGAIRATSLTSTDGIGYGVGAGCTVTQATSKSTGVTCNGMSGIIIMNGAQLNAATSVTFRLTNSSLSTNDVLIVNVGLNASASSYLVGIDGVNGGAGTIDIQLRNITAATNLSETVRLYFVIIKAAIT